MHKASHFLIGAATSGSGKTTLTLGLARALHNMGYSVQPFKCGPDYIDTKYHDIAAGNPSVNLDTFLASEAHVRNIYMRHAQNKDVCITEGVMGLFDGYAKALGSSAAIAQLLKLPVILVINAASMAYSAAPLLFGYKNFEPDLKIAGVIFNFVSGDAHYQYLREACADAGLTPLGRLPKNAGIEIPSRHLGLNLEMAVDAFADKAADFIRQHIEVEQLLALTQTSATPAVQPETTPSGKLCIAIAKDAAFNFMYYENICALAKLGKIIFFSPLSDQKLPNADLIYLPGGYPELHLEQLSANFAMRNSLRRYVENNGKVWAECGGMMYLCDSITDTAGKAWPMAGILQQKASMQPMKLKLGYRYFEHNHTIFKGHEFHYSTLEKALPSLIQQYNAQSNAVPAAIWRYKNALASYTHLYWAENNNLFDLFA